MILIARRLVSWNAAAGLLALFAVHLFLSDPVRRRSFSFLYFGLALGIVALDRVRIKLLLRDDPKGYG